MDVHIELIDDATGDVLAESDVALESLPERFAGMETTLTVAGVDYAVVHAEPATRDTIGVTGVARLRLQRIVQVDPKTILFSLPSIEHDLPRTVATDADVTVRISPDDYRQVEFFGPAAAIAVGGELAEVRRVLAEGRVGPGFRECHVRRGLTAPLAGVRVTVAALAEAVGVAARPIGLRGEPGAVDGGFALPYSDAVVYGVARDGGVTALAVHGVVEDIVGALHPIALELGLRLVDWRKAEVLRAVEEGFAV